MRRSVLLLIALSPLSLAAADIEPCLDCHGGGSAAAALAPSLDGQHADYLRNQLVRYRDGERQAFPMAHLVQGLDDPLIAGIAAAFAARPWFDHAGSADARRIARGAELAAQHDCASCHGDGMRGGGGMPRLAGQNPVYLVQQLTAFANGDRTHPEAGSAARHRFAQEEAEALAAWLAALR